MGMFLQLLILGLAALGLIIMAVEIARIYEKNKVKGKLYVLCVPQTDNIEELCADLLNRYRRSGFGEDIIICGELSQEAKEIGRLIESADKGIYFIEPKDFPQFIGN
ncbi:MAG: hypothetical protein IJP09_02420 [Clostridia bacterium]|nr:hypothetical protein [Clostridia bacterium]